MLNLGKRITETVIMLKQGDDCEAVASDLNAGLSGSSLQVLTWRERLPPTRIRGT